MAMKLFDLSASDRMTSGVMYGLVSFAAYGERLDDTQIRLLLTLLTRNSMPQQVFDNRTIRNVVARTSTGKLLQRALHFAKVFNFRVYILQMVFGNRIDAFAGNLLPVDKRQELSNFIH